MVMCVTRRGECLYLAAWCVCPPYVPEKSRACAYTLTAPHDIILTWRDSKQDSALETPSWIDFYKVRVLPGSDNEQQSHLITELYDWSDNGNTRAEGLLLCICRKMDCS